MVWMRAASILVMAMAALMAGGCGGSATKGPETPKRTPAATTVAADWCVEHGVPESICAQCNAKVAAEYKQKGDWCKEHNRPESQCFLCNPKRAEKFAAHYEAKYGKKTPKPEGS